MLRVINFASLLPSKLLFMLFVALIIIPNVKSSYSFPDDENPAKIYPSETINLNMHKNGKKYAELFGSDSTPMDPEEIREPDKIRHKMERESNHRYFCESRVQLVFPRYGLTENNTTVVIVNTNEFMQGVRVETCEGEKRCNIPHYGLTKCVQSYYIRTLVAYNVDTNEIFKAAIQIPAGCKCAQIVGWGWR